MEKMYLLVYTGNCISNVVNGIKFTGAVRTANVSGDQAKLFVNANGKSLYSDIQVSELVKSDIVPEKTKSDSADFKNLDAIPETLDQLRDIAILLGIDSTGSRTELFDRVTAYEKTKTVE